jgi:general secretion pathway protein A
MYESYWGLQRKPFENTADARFYYPSDSHQAAILKLRYVIESRQLAAVLTGAPGLGKSLIVQTLFRALPDTFLPRVHLVFPQLPAEELLAYLADELAGIAPESTGRSAQESVRRIQQALQQNVRRGQHTVIVVDEAHLIPDSRTVDTLRLLLNFEVDSAAAMTLLFVGQPALLPLLDRHRDLEERLAVKCLLRPLDLEEAIAYVSHRLQQAGASRLVFNEAALEAMHELSRGVPRQINRLGDLALLIGYAEERREISAEAIHAVSQELVTVGPE